MKKTVIFALLLLSAFGMIYAEEKKDDKPQLGVSVEVSRTVAATECYVLFLAEASDATVAEAKTAVDNQLQSFCDEARKSFPGISFSIVTSNIGMRDVGSYRAKEKPVIPAVSKVLICTIPPDELQAAQLLDDGVKAGLLPACGSSYDGIYGAIFYGVKEPEKAIADTLPIATRKLWAEAEKLAALQNGKVGPMLYIYQKTLSEKTWPVSCRDAKISLPSKFNSADKDSICVSLAFSAGFELITEDDK